MSSMIQAVCENETTLMMADEQCPVKVSSVLSKMRTGTFWGKIKCSLKKKKVVGQWSNGKSISLSISRLRLESGSATCQLCAVSKAQSLLFPLPHLYSIWEYYYRVVNESVRPVYRWKRSEPVCAKKKKNWYHKLSSISKAREGFANEASLHNFLYILLQFKFYIIIIPHL